MTPEVRPAAILRRGAALLYAFMHERRRTLIRPTDRPVVRTGGDDALRFVLIGNGLVHGWDVASHQLAPTGELARGIRTLTGRACEVEFVGDAAMSVATATQWAAGRIDHARHGAVIAIGSNDALRLTATAEWGAQLVQLLDAVQAALPEGAPIVLVGIPDVFVPKLVKPLNRMVLQHARRLDRVSERLASLRPQVHWVPSPRLAGFAGQQARDLYGAFTTPIAVALAEAWRRSEVTTEDAADGESFERGDVRSVVEAARWDEVPGLADIVQRARDRFGVTESAVTLVDGDRSWHVASNGVMPASVPKQLSYCETVVATNEPLVVPDAKRDPRFAANPYLDLVHAAFYAGVPLHGSDGTPIGAFCLVNGFPRAADSVDLEGLRELAHEAEVLLRATADAAARDEAEASPQPSTR